MSTIETPGTVQPTTPAATRGVCLGVIVGNRDFFPDSVIAAARARIATLLLELGIRPVMADEQTTNLGTLKEAP